MGVVTGTQYAQPSDLANLGLIGGALAAFTTGQQNAALLARSGYADSKLQARYILPLTQWGQDLVLAVCQMAAYDLMTARGYNPMGGADQNIRQRCLDAEQWLQAIADEKTALAYVIDSSVNGQGATSPPPDDGSVVTTTEGAFQAQTSRPRGWTDRGGRTPPFNDGTGSL